ncbi:MAG: hypothetical protein KGL38_01740 [Gemmatimonadota bacterium]|nr:hypothetical protein [Gemmatimonadota bacterium]MDE3217031.1 hypothetical protein [Gemmatimonadota bacterium]
MWMRTTWTRGAAILLAVGLNACVMSVEPVVSEADARYDARLVGRWTEEDGTDSAVVTRGAGNDYRIAYTTNDNGAARTGRFGARLGQLGAHLVLDVWPAPADSEIPAPYTNTMIPGHQLFGVEIGAGEVRLTTLDADSLGAAIDAGRVRLAATRTRGQVVLRGTTVELRGALAPYLSRPGTLSNEGLWRRAPD